MRKIMNEVNPVTRLFFSVVICTYNRAHLIARAINSLLNQTCKDWECLIIDDESTDDTKEIIAPYLKRKNFHYLPHTHQGCALSKNAGMEAANGKYITFLDSDDEYRPTHLAKRKEILEKEQDIDLLFSDVSVIGDQYVPDKNDPGKKIAIADCTVGGTFVIKRNALKPSDRFKDIYSDDSAFIERFILSGRNTKKINSPTYIYHRDSPDSMCSTI
ncbi:MAG: glycosyltransferase family 2 protein [Chitinophagaceae bacterium]